jgi:hypothetical protein
MKKTNSKSKNFADVLATKLQFAILTKTGRVQILVKPSAKELRKRGKRGWRLFGTIDDQNETAAVLDEIVQQAISDVEMTAVDAERKKKKAKTKKSPTKQ